MKNEYKYYLSTDDSSYGDSTDEEIAATQRRERQICAERGIEVIECDPMLRPSYDADDTHPDSEEIFEQAMFGND